MGRYDIPSTRPAIEFVESTTSSPPYEPLTATNRPLQSLGINRNEENIAHANGNEDFDMCVQETVVSDVEMNNNFMLAKISKCIIMHKAL